MVILAMNNLVIVKKLLGLVLLATHREQYGNENSFLQKHAKNNCNNIGGIKMACSPRIFELTLNLDTKKFHKLLNKARDESEYQLYQKNNKHIDYALASEGIQIVYHDNTYKKKIKLIVNPNLILENHETIRLWEPSDRNIAELIHKLEERIDDYFDYKYKLKDFKLTHVAFTVNTKFIDKWKVSAYIKVLKRIGKVKGFSPANHDRIDKDISFNLKGNSNGIEFTAYDKGRQLKRQLKEKSSQRKELEAKKAEGVLRIEVRLTEQKAIRAYTKETNTLMQIVDLSRKSRKIFFNITLRIVPFAEFQKKDKAAKIIEEKVKNRTMINKMLKLLELIPKKKSLLLAQKALNYRKIDKVMGMFWTIGLSPITISKRHDVKKLKNLYLYLQY